ncbi:hypothetical protein CIW50_04665 [Tardiphaga sp. P9-11]|nr:hypothetical protein CIW50_04665 [Tardiphaga sp. P9-11]
MSHLALDIAALELSAIEARRAALPAESSAFGIRAAATLAAVADVGIFRMFLVGIPAAAATAAAAISRVDHTACPARFRIAG